MKFRQKDFLFAAIARFLLKSQFVRNQLQDLGESASFVSLIKNSLGQVKFFNGREKLWNEITQAVRTPQQNGERDLCVVEYGVAGGDGARWWLRNVPDRSFRYFGFDTFTGLPINWFRQGIIYRPRGFFNQEGKAPTRGIDGRASFVIGDVTDKTEEIESIMRKDFQKIILLDMDLYEPTAFVWKVIAPLLKSGDVIYFDEAFDSSNERRVLEAGILSEINEWRYLGNSTIAVAFQKI